MTKEVDYPQNPEEWKDWIRAHLQISPEDGFVLANQEHFPFDRLIDIWKKEFGVERGYHASFIPALTRNKQGFIEWVYLESFEPNWSKSDSDQ